MIKDLLVPVMLGEPSPAAIATACALAVGLDARVTALVGVSMQAPPAMAWNYFPDGAYETLRDAAKSTAESIAARVRTLLRQYPAASDTRIADANWLTSPVLASMHARHADLVVFGRTPDTPPDAERSLFAALLLDTGRPVLVVPSRFEWPQSLDRAVVAWRPGPEASRALHDALPLLRLAGAVDLVMVEPLDGETRNSELPGAEIAEHLARHELRVNVCPIPREGRTTADAIHHFANDGGAQLIVAGGFGHSRLRETVFGGVTRSLFQDARVPVMFSH